MNSGWENWAVTLATFLPPVGALVIALVPTDATGWCAGSAIVFTGAALVVGDRHRCRASTTARATGCSSQVNTHWIPAIDARYHVGIDGISLPLFELTLLLSFLCAIYSWKIIPSPGGPRRSSR